MDDKQVHRVIESDLLELVKEYEGKPNDDKTKAALKKEMDAMMQQNGRWTTKTDGDGNTIVVDNPDWQSGDGTFRKHRKKNAGYTPPKKKRKKNKKTHRKR